MISSTRGRLVLAGVFVLVAPAVGAAERLPGPTAEAKVVPAVREEPAKPGAKNETEEPLRPTQCKLSGQVKGDAVTLEVRFEFLTSKPNTLVVLGLQGGKAKEDPKLDGQLP